MGRGNIISVIPTRILHKLNQLYRHVCLNAENKRLTSLHKKQRHHCMLEIRSNAFLPQIGGGNSKCHIRPSPHLYIHHMLCNRTCAKDIHRHFELFGSKRKAHPKIQSGWAICNVAHCWHTTKIGLDFQLSFKKRPFVDHPHSVH